MFSFAEITRESSHLKEARTYLRTFHMEGSSPL